MKRLLFLALFLCNLLTSKAEYLVFKEVEGFICLPTEEEHSLCIYPTLMKYQFPMCTNPLNEVSPDEINAPERDLLERKLQEVAPNYRVVFIPTVIYEIFMIEKYTDRTLDLWAEYIFERYLTFIKEEKEITEIDCKEIESSAFSEISCQLDHSTKQTITRQLRNKAMALNYYLLDEPSPRQQYKTLAQIYTEILIPHLHPLSQMGEVYKGINSLGDPRSFHYSAHHTISAILPRPIKTTKEMPEKDSIYNDAQKLKNDSNVKKAHYTINCELGMAIKAFLLKKDSHLILHFYHAKNLLLEILSNISNNLKNPKRLTILSSSSLDSLSEKIEAEAFSPSQQDPRTWWRVRKPYDAIIVRQPYHLLEKLMNKKTKKMLLNVVQGEYSSEEHNCFNLYRGIERSGATAELFPGLKDDHTPSISFGTTLFSGFTGDLKATAFYLAHERSTCLSLSIDKQKKHLAIAKKTNNIVIPPYNTIIGFIGGIGELFHSRTKVPSTPCKHPIPQLHLEVNSAITKAYTVSIDQKIFTEHLRKFLAEKTHIIYESFHEKTASDTEDEDGSIDDLFAKFL
jgi:hypothetical protein